MADADAIAAAETALAAPGGDGGGAYEDGVDGPVRIVRDAGCGHQVRRDGAETAAYASRILIAARAARLQRVLASRIRLFRSRSVFVFAAAARRQTENCCAATLWCWTGPGPPASPHRTRAAPVLRAVLGAVRAGRARRGRRRAPHLPAPCVRPAGTARACARAAAPRRAPLAATRAVAPVRRALRGRALLPARRLRRARASRGVRAALALRGDNGYDDGHDRLLES